MVQPVWKTIWQFFKKLSIELPYDPPIQLVVLYPKDVKTGIQTKTCVQMFIEVLSQQSKWKNQNVHQLDKQMWSVHNNRMLLSRKKE